MPKSRSSHKDAFALQLRIELLNVEPPIWRRMQVLNDCSFWDLHVAIQDAMGWTDSHLHMFRFIGSDLQLGIPDEEQRTQPGRDRRVTDLLHPQAPLALYEYDFGDGWMHEVRFEHWVPREAAARYPRCLAGARACPPEDCGGPEAYGEMLRVLADPSDPEYASQWEWCGDEFDPEAFDPLAVRFQDPKKRWRDVFG